MKRESDVPPVVETRDDGVVITRAAGRVRPRHELEGTYNVFGERYFENRSYGFTIEDHVAAGESRIEVRIPATVADGQVLRIAGKGHPGANGGPGGDLLIEISVDSHHEFTRQGKNIRSSVRVPLKIAVLGGKVTVNTLREEVELAVPSGTSSDSVLRLKGQGAGGDDPGDHLVRVILTVPEQPSDELKAALEDL